MKQRSLLKVMVLILLLVPLQDLYADQVYPYQGVTFHQMDFTFENGSVINSQWGQLEMDLPMFFNIMEVYSSGYINVRTAEGWVVQNMPVDTASPHQSLGVNFDLGQAAFGEPLMYLYAYVEFTVGPLTTFPMGDPVEFEMGEKIEFDAEGGGEEDANDPGPPPEPYPDSIIYPSKQTYSCVQPGHTNVEAAQDQCVPMAVANSLDYLKNRYGLPIPDPHVMGLKGDNSLVGKLGQLMNRAVTDRRNGSGVWMVPMMQGKLSYLSNPVLAGKVSIKHQGRGYGPGFPAGNYTHAGQTSVDHGPTVTAAWLVKEICDGEDVEIIYQHSRGGHAVMLVEAGYTNGVPYIKYAHDRTQSDDTKGLEVKFSTLVDLDGDGDLNLHNAASNEIVFAVSESPTSDIPTLTEWGMIIFCVLLFGWMAWMIVKRRKTATINI